MFKAKTTDVPRLLREEGLDAFEYEAVRWGKKPQMKQEEAEKLGVEANAHDVWLSMHGSYYINLCGDRKIVEDSKQRLVACATAADWMKAHVLAFHLGFYGFTSRKQALANCVNALKRVTATLEDMSITDVDLGLETSGKRTQLGSLDEILSICKEIERTQPVVDWAHLHAAGQGLFLTVADFRKVFEKIEDELGTNAVKNLHCHFSKIEFTSRGERRHHVLDEARYGPDFAPLARTIKEFRLNPVIICETALQDIDAMKMRDIFNKTSGS
jgi:deoxyribonuclease-4